jgi:hypothetical protein
MIVQVITKAKNATVALSQVKRAIRDLAGIRANSDVHARKQTGYHGDSVYAAVQLRQRLQEELERKQAYAIKCQKEMYTELDRVPDEITRKLFYDRHYLSHSWEQAAEEAGISTGAAKMRCKRYVEQEHAKNAA